MSQASFILVLALMVGVRPADPCPSAVILDRLWQASFSAVEQEMAAAKRGERVDLAQLEHYVSTLGTLSGIEANITYFGYLPDEKLRSVITRWRDWYAGGTNQFCAPLVSSSPRAGNEAAGRVGKETEVGCVGQQRLTRLWLSNLRSLERILQDLENARPISFDRLEKLTRFFGDVSGLPIRKESARPLGIVARLDLMASVGKWQDWFASNVGAMCDP